MNLAHEAFLFKTSQKFSTSEVPIPLPLPQPLRLTSSKLQNHFCRFTVPPPHHSLLLGTERTYFSGMASGSADLLGNYRQLSGCLTDEAQGSGRWHQRRVAE